MRRSWFLALLLSFALLIGTAPAVLAAEQTYSDVPADHWASGVIGTWSSSDYGVLQGNGDGTFAPSRALTLGELATVLSRTFGYQAREAAEVTPAWADEAVEKAIAAGVIAPAASVDAGGVVTRQEAVRYIALAYGIAPMEGNTEFPDDAEIGADYKPYVHAMQEMGALSGRETGIFDPLAPYTRAEAVQLIDNLTADILDTDAEGRSYDNSLIVRADGVTLTDVTVGGDLIIGQGVGDGEVTLDGVTVDGRLIVYGGGQDSITIYGNCNLQTIILNKTFGEPVHLKLGGNPNWSEQALLGRIPGCVIAAGSRAIVTGNYSMLTLVCEADVDVTVTADSRVKTVEVLGDNVVLTVEKDGQIDRLIIDGQNGEVNIERGADVPRPTGDGASSATVNGSTSSGSSGGSTSSGGGSSSGGDGSGSEEGEEGETYRVLTSPYGSGGGSIQPSTGRSTEGKVVSFTVQPNSGCSIVDISVIYGDNQRLPWEYDDALGAYTFTMPASDVTIQVEFQKNSQEPDFPDPVNPVYSVEELNQAIAEGKTTISIDAPMTIGDGQTVVIPAGVEVVIYRTTLSVGVGGTLTVNGTLSALGETRPMQSISGNSYEASFTIPNYSNANHGIVNGTGNLNGIIPTDEQNLPSPGSTFFFYWDEDGFRPRLRISNFDELKAAVQLDVAEISVDGPINITENLTLPKNLEMEIYGSSNEETHGVVTVAEGVTLTLGENTQLFAVWGEPGGELHVDGQIAGADNCHIYQDNTDLYLGYPAGTVTGLPVHGDYTTWHWIWQDGAWLPAEVDVTTAAGLLAALATETIESIDVPEGASIDVTGQTLALSNPALSLRVVGNLRGAESIGVYDTDIDMEYLSLRDGRFQYITAHVLTAEEYAESLEMEDLSYIVLDRKSGSDYNRVLTIPDIVVREGQELGIGGSVTVTGSLTIYGNMRPSGNASLTIGPDVTIDAVAPYDGLQAGKTYTYSGGAWVESATQP